MVANLLTVGCVHTAASDAVARYRPLDTRGVHDSDTDRDPLDSQDSGNDALYLLLSETESMIIFIEIGNTCPF